MDFTQSAAIVGGMYAAFKWVYEYSQKLKWEKNKFLLERFEVFNAKESVKKMHKFLDWNSSYTEFGDKRYLVDDVIMFNALETHKNKKTYTALEFMLREVFDEYFDSLNELVLLAKAGMIDEKNLRLFLKYWLQIMNGTKKSKKQEFLMQLEEYISFYGYDNVHEFIYM
jgi:hypothetical protein